MDHLSEKNQALYTYAREIKLRGDSWTAVVNYLDSQGVEPDTRKLIVRKVEEDFKAQEEAERPKRLAKAREKTFYDGLSNTIIGGLIVFLSWIFFSEGLKGEYIFLAPVAGFMLGSILLIRGIGLTIKSLTMNSL